MAEASSSDAGAPNLNLTPEEKRVYGQLFRQADTDNVGVVTGDIAVKFFEKTRLDSRVLGEIWQIADKENRGFLTPAGFGIVLRLIGHAQAGREPTPEIALQQAPIPRFDGFTPAPPPLAPVPTGPVAQPIQAQGTGSGPIRIPPLTPEKVAQYAGLFERQPLQAGNLLPGDQAKQIFEKSGLPNEVLGRIWQLADTEQRGALVLTEFVIAMHLLTSMKTGTLRGLPTILPAALYEAATRRGPGAGARPQSPQTTGAAPLSAIPRQLSGQAGHPVQMRTGSPLGAHVRSPLASQSTGDGWLITPADKVRFDAIYDDLDKAKRGFISGEEAVPFFKQSNLPEDTLAQIWDLADIRSEGHLNKDEFAVAMYLIRQQRSSRSGQNTLPATLPPNLMPPSLRGLARPPTSTGPFDIPPPQQAAAPAAPPPQPKPASALDDLFGLDSAPTPPAPIQSAMATGSSNPPNDPFAGAASPIAPGSPARPSPTTTSTFKPFVPSSSFGRSIIPQATGDSQSSAGGFPKPSAPPQPSASDDLLGDADPEISKKLTNDTAELANLSNQIGSLSKQMQEVQGQRSATQNELNQASVQKKNFEQRLAQLRALYEKEAKDVRALQEQLTSARNDTKKIQTEMAMLEGTYHDLQNQHRTILAGLQADQQENANLKERIRAVNAEVAALKPQIEKLKSEARQQKGLVAINKKQLATNEAEREKLKTEAEELTKENEELARQLSQSPPPPAAAPPPQVASPAPSTASANNPFFRRTGSTDIMGAFASPGAKTFNDKSFDDVFGPSFPSSTPPPPATSFKPQNTGTSATSTGSFATPATSTTPNVSRQPTLTVEQPPAPSESRQMSPSFLPFGDPTESLTSSTQVSPPMSRLGPETPAVETPGAAIAPPLEATATGQSATSTSSPSEVKAPEATSNTNGAAVESAWAAPTVTDETKDDAAPEPTPDSFSAVDQAKAKEDFESAFASFKASNPGKSAEKSNTDTVKGFSAFNTEFPPISQLERDEESDSDDDKGGFDDDFAPASPPSGKGPAQPGSPTLTKSSANEGTPVAANASPEASSDKAQVPPATTSKSEADDIFGAAAPPGAFPEPSPVPLSTTTNTAPPAVSQPVPAHTSNQPSAFDDLDDEFADLEDAKEGSDHDDFQTISRSGLDDFNPVFDSSPPASQSTIKSESTTGPSGGIAGTGAPFGTDSSYDFASLGSNSAATSNLGASTASTAQPATAAGSKGPNPPESHDWDAIFASLDDAPASSPTTANPPAAAAQDSGNAAARPEIGRALTEEGEHDDPILKNLTSMGYSRKDALLALEKYDYNLERAANYLASQS